ncbi:MAG: ribonuclease III domain-containing protein [Candidatus Borkfalkiaceae bacterium]|nr:ribonuclease III domain-containing protein [Christensenellaceae bacterium]
MFDINQHVSPARAKLINPVVLAYVGDSVHSLFVRKRLALNHDLKSSELNKMEASEVCATAQAAVAKKIADLLSSDELAVFKRARNSKKGSHAKNSSLGDYSKATGLEAVIGYLYLSGQEERLNFVLNFCADCRGSEDSATLNAENILHAENIAGAESASHIESRSDTVNQGESGEITC